MRVSLKWLREYVDFDLTPEELAHRLTMAGLEVGGIERIGGGWDNVLVGHVERLGPHPNAIVSGWQQSIPAPSNWKSSAARRMLKAVRRLSLRVSARH